VENTKKHSGSRFVFQGLPRGTAQLVTDVNSGNKPGDEGRVWLLPHAGGERVPGSGENVCPWPEEPEQHGRKFLQVHGCAIQRSGDTVHGEVCVWAEYEAPTHARPVESEGQGPRFVQTPLITVSQPAADTDPWIFHPGFVWSTCRHESTWHCPPQPGDPRQPLPGDIVLFGSPLRGAHGKTDWVLDTVVVVKRRLSGPTASGLKNPYLKLVQPALRQADAPLLPFVGQPHERAARYSFAPCKLAAHGRDACFERPSINALLGDLRLATGERPIAALTGLAMCRPDGGLDRFWKSLTELIWSRGLALGADFDLPAIRVVAPAPAPRETKSAARKRRARAA
jgi:hypothetical protein